MAAAVCCLSSGFEDVSELVEYTPSLSESFEFDRQSSSSLLLSQLFALPCDHEADPEPGSINRTNSHTSAPLTQKIPASINHDAHTLVGTFEETEGFQEQLCFVQHPIVKDYIENKEKSLVPYIPVYSPQFSHSEPSLKVCYSLGNLFP